MSLFLFAPGYGYDLAGCLKFLKPWFSYSGGLQPGIVKWKQTFSLVVCILLEHSISTTGIKLQCHHIGLAEGL